MTQRTKQRLWETRAATFSVMATMILTVAPFCLANGGNGSTGSAWAASITIRRSPSKRGKRSFVREASGVKALAEMRDPFNVPPPPHPGAGNDATEGPLPPGARGLVIGRLKLKGIVREDASGTMIAVVTDQRNLAYFLRIHDEVYNGVVAGITPDAIAFIQKSPNTGDRGESRQVVLKLGSGRQEVR